MSDEEFYSEESYEFEFEDEDSNSPDEGMKDDSSSLETMYYHAKGLKYDDTRKAVSALQEVVASPAEDEANYVFKAHKQLIKILFHSGDLDCCLEWVKKMLQVLPASQYGEDSLNKMISVLSAGSQHEFAQNVFETVLGFLGGVSGFDRIWLRISVIKLKQSMEDRDLDTCKRLIGQIYNKLETVSESNRKQYLLDVIAAEIEYLSDVTPMDIPKLTNLHKQSVALITAVTHPRLVGVIQECGARLHFYKGNYEKARLDFYDSFNSYDEAGSPLKKKILKYLTLCSLLTENQFNPFESQETSTYAVLPEYSKLLGLIRAYDDSELQTLISVIEEIKMSSDPLAKDHVFISAASQIIANLKAKMIKNYMKAYSKVGFDFLSQRLQLEPIDLENFLRRLVITGVLQNVKLDFMDRIVISEGVVDHFPLTLNAKEIHYNMKMAHMTNITSLTGADDAEISKNRFLFVVDKPSNEVDRFKLVEEWFLYVRSCVPPPVKNEMSQKDQIAFEQKAELNKTPVVNDEAVKNTQSGILSSTIEEEEDNELHTEPVRRVDILGSWLNELEEFYVDLTK